MNVIDLLAQGIVDSDWSKINQAYQMLAGVEVDTPSKPIEPTPKKKRGRPKKVKEVEEIRGIKANDIIYDDIVDELNVVVEKPTQVVVKQSKSDQNFIASCKDENAQIGQQRVARLEDFQKPVEPNKFVPPANHSLDPEMVGVNDNVTPTPRNRPKAEACTVFCQDCQQNITVAPMFKKDPYYCEYPRIKKPCPFAK